MGISSTLFPSHVVASRALSLARDPFPYHVLCPARVLVYNPYHLGDSRNPLSCLVFCIDRNPPIPPRLCLS